MSNKFIEELRRKASERNQATVGSETDEGRIKKAYPWLSDEEVEDEVFEGQLKKAFNPAGIGEKEER